LHPSTGKALESNAFLSPRWGGIAIYNVPDAPESSPVPREVTLQMAPIVNVFRHQLALLLGIEPTKEGVLPNVGRSPPDGSRITHWEIDVLLRQRAAENLVTATNTLQSLAQLLEEIGNIVIRDDIAEQVRARRDTCAQHFALVFAHTNASARRACTYGGVVTGRCYGVGTSCHGIAKNQAVHRLCIAKHSICS
ncbi:PREDICTED: GPI transamidase component PIG-S-like, partial [Priapulus caudatus]|uniref:GPI transamidase component PIG-S-like n=1 Tax=Priapulus caudatus TaxID=37621 RepID=A0ABM1F7F7_PRICU